MTEELSGLNILNSNMLTEEDKSLNIISSITNPITLCDKDISESDDENKIRFTKARTSKRVNESDGDTVQENDTVCSPHKPESDDDIERQFFASKKKSRIRNIPNSGSDSDSNTENGSMVAANKYDLTRTKFKNKRLQDKFKKLKEPKGNLKKTIDKPLPHTSDSEANSSDGAISCLKIKQRSKKKSIQTLTSICDPDTSEDETNDKSKHQKSKPRSIKLTSPKPVRMSAKEAMENMQKIKSESNRMLREKDVSLPYHRPKALNLKDIMNRRKPALTSDGKSMPIKMNNEQLKQYALMLEERQKEMMELCKSDTDEDEHNYPENDSPINKSNNEKECMDSENTFNQESYSSFETNDKIYDGINMEEKLNDSKHCNTNEQNIEDTMQEEDVNKTLENDREKLANGINDNSDNITANAVEKKQRTIETPILLENDLNNTLNTRERQEKNELHMNNLGNGTTEQETQEISLHYDDSERTELEKVQATTNDSDVTLATPIQEITESVDDQVAKDVTDKNMSNNDSNKNLTDEFSDNDFPMDELEQIIEIAQDHKGKDTSNKTLEMKPKLTGTPGMVIDLNDNGQNTERRLTGVELLKERFTYFAKLKSLEDMEKDREKKFKPGIQHLKLKQELEDQIAEQRSLEWEKRLQIENQLKSQNDEVRAEEFDGEEIEKIEAKLEENDLSDEDDESSCEEDIDDTDVYDLKDKPRKRNPLIDDEAEVSEDEGDEKAGDNNCKEGDVNDNDDHEVNEEDDTENDSGDDDEESSESEEDEQRTKCKKGRIIKAFEDSDDENSKSDPILDNVLQSQTNEIRESQDDEIQLAQPQKTYSDDLFTSQEFSQRPLDRTDESKVADTSIEDLGSQTFSILNSGTENVNNRIDAGFEKFDVICETQPCSDENFDAIVGMCTGGFADNLVTPQVESSQLSQSQDIGDDATELCAGMSCENSFISQAKGENENGAGNKIEDESIIESNVDSQDDENTVPEISNVPKPTNAQEGENKLLKSILEELHDPEFDSPKPNKYFANEIKSQNTKNTVSDKNTEFKKKFVIESDDENCEEAAVSSKKKKRKKRKLENRALQISDDDEDYSEPDQDINESDVEDGDDRLIEYDSEENEVEIQTRVPKKKRVGNDFFEQEAELTSEDEWIGSGDEDEAGLDRMEREEGDDDTFHQGKLQRELGEIHMREVLDQDKREVRLLQELLFEDGDLGDGHRQRKFRWKNADGEEELGTNADEYADTQEDEFESEEQWRKQRHEREMFLRTLQEKDGADEANVTMNRSAFIKAKLASMSASRVDCEKQSNTENCGIEPSKPHDGTEKKMVNSIPSPKKPFILLQQNYHNSLLTRGRGALARLAALATPLAGDGDDAPKVNASSNRGNFVFATITPTDAESKVPKRKADTAQDTPRLLKKMKQEYNKNSKVSLLDHL